MPTNIYFQLPSNVWWRLRDRFRKSIPSKVTANLIASDLGVQLTAAKAYLGQLQAMGLVDDEGTPTELVKKWRMDATYREAADVILKKGYPQELRDLSPPENFDRTKVKTWFMNQGLGEGSANNRAATYALIASSEIPQDIPQKKAKPSKVSKDTPVKTKGKAVPVKADKNSGSGKVDETPGTGAGGFPLNVNVQIHISADASNEQIEAIFANMKKYLR